MDMQQLSDNIINDVKRKNPEASWDDIVARLTGIGFHEVFAEKLISNWLKARI